MRWSVVVALLLCIIWYPCVFSYICSDGKKTLFVPTAYNINSIWDSWGSQLYILSKQWVNILMNYCHLHVKDNCAMYCYMVDCLVQNILWAAAFMGSVFLFLLKQDSKQTKKTRTKYHFMLAMNLCKCHISSDQAILTNHNAFILLETSDGTFPKALLQKVANIWPYFQFALDLAFQTGTWPQGALCYFSVADQEFV